MRASRSLLAALALPFYGFTTEAGAASFDCTKPATLVDKTVCADHFLSARDDQLAERLAVALKQSLDPAELRIEQHSWHERLERRPPAVGALSTAYKARISEIEHEIARLSKIEPARTRSEASARANCPPLFDDDKDMVGGCEVLEFGEIGAVDGNALLYGLYVYHDADDDLIRRTSVVVYERRGDVLRALFAPIDEGGYDVPTIVTSAERTMLQLRGSAAGSGNGNIERVFVWWNGSWADLDTTSWVHELADRLPEGYWALDGIYPDYREMTAATPLWRAGVDAHCCPTGGRANMTFSWDSDRLVIKSLDINFDAKWQ
jgi:uncharacterized protein